MSYINHYGHFPGSAQRWTGCFLVPDQYGGSIRNDHLLIYYFRNDLSLIYLFTLPS